MSEANGTTDAGIERQLNQLDADIRRLRVDYQRFLAGDLHIPPEDLRESIHGRLRRLRTKNLKAAADNFRLNSLEARYNSYAELYSRRLREREEGSRRVAGAEQEKRPDAQKGVVIGQKAGSDEVTALYKGLYLRDGTRQPKASLESFQSYLDRQAQAIRQKTGCSEIEFRVAEEGGKLKLKAKPLRRS